MTDNKFDHHPSFPAGKAAVQGLLVVLLVCLQANAQDFELRKELLARPLDPNLGGETTIVKDDERAFERIIANATTMTKVSFNVGRTVFETDWEAAPGLQPATDGLGPLFHQDQCSDCHENNGRGRPPETEGGPMESMLVRLSIPGSNNHGGPNPIPLYGDQLQDHAVDGVPAEGRAVMTWTEQDGTYGDGTPYSLRKPELTFADLSYGEMPANAMSSARVGNPVIGLGLLEAVPDVTLHALADPEDQDGDGISGRVNLVWDAPTAEMAVGRFGWKANVASLKHQTAAAALGDMGITSPIFMEDHCDEGQTACQQKALDVEDHPPEVRPELFERLVQFNKVTAVPAQRNSEDADVKNGEALFRDIGCSSCHMTTLMTGESEHSELSDQVIHPFTDLLLHDMGEGLADGRPDFEASGSEWRTQPLWGIGLTKRVSGFSLFLHDGRARSFAEAILWHGGEAEAARENFRELGAEQRTALIDFLNSI